MRVSLDLADLTAAPRARTLAVHARLNPGVLQSADDLEKVIPMLQAQDHDVAFREMLTSNRTEAQGLEFVASQAAGKAGSAQVRRDKERAWRAVVGLAGLGPWPSVWYSFAWQTASCKQQTG